MKLRILSLLAAAAALPAPARAQAAASASVNATARFVEPVGVASAAEPGLAPVAASQREVRAVMTPGSLTVTGPENQTFSVETTARPVLKQAGGAAEVRLDVSAARNASKIQVGGELAEAEAAPAGVYSGQLSTVVNLN